jgi:flagellar biosynthesis/type III secretory pathway protein FliH
LYCQRVMKNSSSPSAFSFDDLSLPADQTVAARFVNLFAGEEGREAETEIGEKHDLPSAEDEVRKVFEDAYVQGEKAGFEMGMRRVESIAKRLEKQISEVLDFRVDLKARYEKLSVELALIFTEALVIHECQERKETVGAMIKKALEACDARGDILIRVRAEDAANIEHLSSDHLQILKDESLKEPGFVIETNLGDIDGRLSTQIDELKASLIGFHAE